MSILRPFPRIFLPSRTKQDNIGLLKDERYISSSEKSSLLNAARIIIYDFKHLLDYIEPVEDNKKAYSHRIYELLLRTATEFEANCKGILIANGYEKEKGNFNIQDYHQINKLMKLDQYVVTTHLWNPIKTFRPLAEWESGHSLEWYKAYNEVKHNRIQYFYKANLDNLFTGICSLIVVLTAQFNSSISFISNTGFSLPLNNGEEISITNFTIKLPHFEDTEKYDFDYNNISNDGIDFDKYFIMQTRL